MITKMISLDTSTKNTGFAIFNNAQYEKSGLIDLTLNNKDTRTEDMIIRITRVLNEENPSILVIEECVVVRNAQVQRILLRLQGAILYWCIQNDCEFNVIRPTEWRKFAGINSKKTGIKKREELKAMAISRVKELYGIDVDEDQAESILIGVAHIERFKEVSNG